MLNEVNHYHKIAHLKKLEHQKKVFEYLEYSRYDFNIKSCFSSDLIMEIKGKKECNIVISATASLITLTKDITSILRDSVNIETNFLNTELVDEQLEIGFNWMNNLYNNIKIINDEITNFLNKVDKKIFNKHIGRDAVRNKPKGTFGFTKQDVIRLMITEKGTEKGKVYINGFFYKEENKVLNFSAYLNLVFNEKEAMFHLDKNDESVLKILEE